MQPLIQQAKFLKLPLDILVGVFVLFGRCRALLENLLEVAGAVNNDAVVLLYEILSYCLLKPVGMLCCTVE